MFRVRYSARTIRITTVVSLLCLFFLSAQPVLAAVAFGAIGTANAGSTSLSIPYPASVAAGNLLVMTIVNKYPTNAPTVPSGWEAIASSTGRGGTGSAGNDTGDVYITVFVRVATSTESGNVPVTITSGNCAIGSIARYTKAANTYWNIAAMFGSDNISGSTAWSVTAAANPGITSGDIVIAASGINTDLYTFTSQSMSATGATFTTHTERLDTTTTTGGQCGLVVSDHTVTAGTASAAPVFTMTASGSAVNSGTGATVFLRIRETANPTADSLVLTDAVSVTGAISVLGTLAKGAGSFVIDHPLDPKNKLLYHSFVESPDVKNIYDGITNLDEDGKATIELPSYFLALNKDYRYLGTPVGQPMPNLYLEKGVRKRFFGLFGTPVLTISGGAVGGKVSWQVTGIRKDPFILANPIIPVVEKGPDQLVDKGEYICEECYR